MNILPAEQYFPVAAHIGIGGEEPSKYEIMLRAAWHTFDAIVIASEVCTTTGQEHSRHPDGQLIFGMTQMLNNFVHNLRQHGRSNHYVF